MNIMKINFTRVIIFGVFLSEVFKFEPRDHRHVILRDRMKFDMNALN